MKHGKLSLLLVMIAVLLVSAIVPLTNPITESEQSHTAIRRNLLSYETHDFFYIVGDSELATVAAAESWIGDGSPGNPFLIQGYSITPEIENIHIQDTRLHVKILDCNLTYSLYSIGLTNTTNITIQNCLFSNNSYGVNLVNSTGIDIVGCNFSFSEYGESSVYMESCFDISIQDCVMQGAIDTDAGIYGTYSGGITIYNNTIYEFDNHGIFFGGSNNIDILNNMIYWNDAIASARSCGIYLVDGLFANITGNNITENHDSGITLNGFSNTTITDNYISGNWYHGIDVEWSIFCVIENNWIGGNGEGIIGGGPLCGIFSSYSDYLQIGENDFWWNTENTLTIIYSNFAHIYGNYINHSHNHGMYLFESPNATIEANEIYNSDGIGSTVTCGIYLEDSSYVSLLENILGQNTQNGISVYSSDGGEIIGNTIFDSGSYGIMVSDGTTWNISYNVIFDNGGPGIYMDVPTSHNLIYSNDIGWCSGVQAVDEGFGNYWNSTNIGNWYSDYNGTGTYTIHGASTEIDYYPSMSLFLGTSTPYEYEVGTTGNTMTWAASALNPDSYELLIDGVSQGLVIWDGSEIAADVDGLPVGVYNATLIVYHISGHWLANQSVLTVIDTAAPTWTVTPQDQTLDYNEPLSYQLQASDSSGIESWTVNNTAGFSISSTGLLTNATILASGVYYVEVTVTDVYSNSLTITLMITVNELTIGGPVIDPTTLALSVGGAGVAVVIIIAVVVIKKKGS
jgi:parallel beta-helix repeat protein